jgi:hypothetical protein
VKHSIAENGGEREHPRKRVKRFKGEPSRPPSSGRRIRAQQSTYSLPKTPSDRHSHRMRPLPCEMVSTDQPSAKQSTSSGAICAGLGKVT